MNLFLTLAFLLPIGSALGRMLELFFRRFFSSANPLFPLRFRKPGLAEAARHRELHAGHIRPLPEGIRA